MNNPNMGLEPYERKEEGRRRKLRERRGACCLPNRNNVRKCKSCRDFPYGECGVTNPKHPACPKHRY